MGHDRARVALRAGGGGAVSALREIEALHRYGWLARRCAGRRVTVLGARDDLPREVLSGSEVTLAAAEPASVRGDVVVWLEGVTAQRLSVVGPSLAAHAGAGHGVVVGIEPGGDGALMTEDAELVAERLGGVVLEHHDLHGWLVAPPGGGEATIRVRPGSEPARLLAVANLEAGAGEAAATGWDPVATALRLERARDELLRANAALGAGKLTSPRGVAAASQAVHAEGAGAGHPPERGADR